MAQALKAMLMGPKMVEISKMIAVIQRRRARSIVSPLFTVSETAFINGILEDLTIAQLCLRYTMPLLYLHFISSHRGWIGCVDEGGSRDRHSSIGRAAGPASSRSVPTGR